MIDDVQSKIGEARGKSSATPGAAADPATQADVVDPPTAGPTASDGTPKV